jgi:hypothetical protein
MTDDSAAAGARRADPVAVVPVPWQLPGRPPGAGPRGHERGVLFAPDLVGPSEQIVERLRADVAVQQVTELRIELPLRVQPGRLRTDPARRHPLSARRRPWPMCCSGGSRSALWTDAIFTSGTQPSSAGSSTMSCPSCASGACYAPSTSQTPCGGTWACRCRRTATPRPAGEPGRPPQTALPLTRRSRRFPWPRETAGAVEPTCHRFRRRARPVTRSQRPCYRLESQTNSW